MQTKQTTPQTQIAPEFFADMQSKALEAFSVFSEMNHRVLQELVGLSASTTKEGMRAYAELQAATVEAARTAQAPVGQPDTLDEFRRNPFAWYQKSLLSLVEATQKTFRLLEANAQVVTRSAERLQVSTDRTGREIQEALTSSVSRMKEIYARN